MLEFYDADEKLGSVSIYETHITFNKNLLKYFAEAYRVRIGCDVEEGALYAFLIDKDYALSGEIKESSLLKISVSKTYARISSTPVVKYIQKVFNLEIPSGKYVRFDAEYDEKKKAILIKLGGSK